MNVLCLTPLLALLVSQVAYAQTNEKADIVRGLCQKDGCQEFTVLGKQPVATGADGQLCKTQVRTFHPSYEGRTTQRDENGFV